MAGRKKSCKHDGVQAGKILKAKKSFAAYRRRKEALAIRTVHELDQHLNCNVYLVIERRREPRFPMKIYHSKPGSEWPPSFDFMTDPRKHDEDYPLPEVFDPVKVGPVPRRSKSLHPDEISLVDEEPDDDSADEQDATSNTTEEGLPAGPQLPAGLDVPGQKVDALTASDQEGDHAGSEVYTACRLSPTPAARRDAQPQVQHRSVFKHGSIDGIESDAEDLQPSLLARGPPGQLSRTHGPAQHTTHRLAMALDSHTVADTATETEQHDGASKGRMNKKGLGTRGGQRGRRGAGRRVCGSRGTPS